MKNELVIMPNNLGDVIMTTPILRGIKEKRRSSISFLVEKGFEGGLINNPFCDYIIYFPRKEIRDLWNDGSFSAAKEALSSFVTEVNDSAYDHIINLSQFEHVSFVASLIRCNTLVGRTFLREGNHAILDKWSQYLYSIPFARTCNKLHSSDIYKRIADVDSNVPLRYEIFLSEKEKKEAGIMLKHLGVQLDTKKIAFFQPGAAIAAKRWHPSSFVKLGKLLTSNGWSIIVSGASAEKMIADDIAEKIGERCVCIAGKTTFRQAVACLSFSNACVSGDTAIMHAASAFKKRVYALFGSTNPIETGPYGEGHWIFAGKCTSRPCFCTTCKNMICMKSILPQTVFSCMVHENPGISPQCDVYRTSFDKDGFTLLPCAGSSINYYDNVSAYLTLSALQSCKLPKLPISAQTDMAIEHSRKIISCLKAMEKQLATVTTGSIKEFERMREELSKETGIGAFWSAFANIRLNSVPLLDINKGIAESIEEIKDLRAMINNAVQKLESR